MTRAASHESAAFKNAEFENPKFENDGKSRGIIDDIFLKHPREAGENYLIYLLFTLWVGLYLIVTALCAVAHGLCPRIFTATASGRVKRLSEIMQARREKFMNAAH